MNAIIDIRDTDIRSTDAQLLLGELNDTLTRITGASGALSFTEDDVSDSRAAFVIAYVDNKPVGCGALRPMCGSEAEIKRVYARPGTRGVGSAVVRALEQRARALGYSKLLLETRKVNANAVRFYQKLGYTVCDNFGKYIGREYAVCMEKLLNNIEPNNSSS